MDRSTGEPDRPPSKVGVAVTDLMTGLYAHGAILAGLHSVQHTGKGVWIDCNLFETQVQWLSHVYILVWLSYAYQYGFCRIYLACGSCEYSVELSYRRKGSLSARNCPPVHRSLPSFPMQRRISHDWRGQRQAGGQHH